MPCPACGEDPVGTSWSWDPLRWELDPPCSEAEWKYLADLPGAPESMRGRSHEYAKKLCRGCYNVRIEIMARIKTRIRERGGIEEMKPTMRMKKEYAEAHAADLVARRPARIDGLQSAAAASLNGQLCKLLKQDPDTLRWTVELVSGEQKAIKEANLSASLEIDAAWDEQKHKFYMNNPEALGAAAKAVPRPLGEKTKWPKVQGIHPGAVVTLRDLKAAAELNGRKGRCITFDEDIGRWKVDLGDEYKSLKVDNLTPAPGEKPPTRESAASEKENLQQSAARRATQNAKEQFAEDYGWDG